MHSSLGVSKMLSALSILPLLLASFANARKDDKILLSTVHSLTFQADAMTSHRRVAAVPQLTCKGPACPYYTVSSLRCTNAGAGYDAEDIQWTCTASLPEAFKLGSTDVQCEGYSSSSDKHVLRGSCGATYRLMFTPAGEREYAEQLARDRSWFSGSKSSSNKYTDESSGGISSKLFMIVFVAVAAWILYNAYLRSTQPQRRPAGRVTGPRRPGGGGGGGGGGGWWPGGGPGGGGGSGFGGWNTGSDPSDDPPPPYTPNPGPRYTKSAPSGSSRSRGGQDWGGFWTGALGGAAAGYFAGSRRRPRDGGNGGYFQEPSRRGWGGGGGGWGGGSSGAPGPSSSSGRTHESTGFGGTSRR